MRCCDLHLPALVEWPEGQGIEECPLCAALRTSEALRQRAEELRERLAEAQGEAEWVAHMRPGGQR